MPYNKQIWEDLPNKTTPLSAERLNHLEKQYGEAVKDAKSYTDNAISNIPPPEFLGVGSINGVGETDMWLELDPRISGPLTSGNAVFAFCGSSTTRRGEWVNGFMDQVFHRFGKGEVLNISEASEVDMGTGIYGVISGFSGGKAGDYLDSDKAEAISDLNPNVVFHMVGSSDWAVGTPLDSYRINLNNAINRISSSNPILHVLIRSFDGTINSYTSTNILENLPDWFLPRGRHVWGTCWGGSSGNGVLGDVVVRSDNNNNVGVVMDKSASKIRGSVIYTLP